MSDEPIIDITFDMRSDTPEGKDPDSHSPTLRRYHRLLWSKELPSGERLDLADNQRNSYPYHQSDRGEFFLASDSLVHSFKGWDLMEPVLAQLDDGEVEAFRDIGYTIGGFTVFSGLKVDNRPVLNGARGMNRHRIADRMDFTLECIRRHYTGDNESPLGAVIARDAEFFGLFETFDGYVDFFHFQDLVDERAGRVRFLLPFTGFETSALPADVGTYREYRDNSVEFVRARNTRIDTWAKANANRLDRD